MKKEGKIPVLILSVLEHRTCLVAEPNHLVMGRYHEKEAICMGIKFISFHSCSQTSGVKKEV